MIDYKIVCDNGTVTIIRANKRSTAIKLYCESEGCDKAWVKKHCRVVFSNKGKTIEQIREDIRNDG